jgi:3-oxoacyl-[acyl-carrier-protein] synthase II
MGVVTSLGHKVEEVWTAVLNGKSGIHPLQRFDCSAYRVRFGGEISEWSVAGYVEPRDEKKLDRFTQFALVAGVEAVRNAGLDFSKEDSFRCGVMVGSGIGGLWEIETQHERLLTKGPDKVSAFTIPKLIANSASAQLSIEWGLRGPNAAIVTACASAANSIGEAFRNIRYDDADVMIAGGSESAVTRMGVAGFASMRALSERNDDPPRASRPFDRDRDGFVLSEGAGIMVLEELEHAKARGAHIYAEILGYGTGADGGHITQPDKEGTGAAHAMRLALRDAKLDATDIDYINAHGTSTPLGDQAETTAIKTVFQDHAYKLSVSSTKSQLGHLLGASGGVELIFSVLAIRDSVIPPTINLDNADPLCDLDYTPLVAKPRAIGTAMSNSFGFGGHNGSLIVGKLRE